MKVIPRLFSSALFCCFCLPWWATGATTPSVQSASPAPGSTLGSLAQITVTFSEPVTNVVATDLRANDNVALQVTGSGSVYTFTFEAQPDYGIVQITWDPAHGIRDQETPSNRFDENAAGSTWQYTLIDLTPPELLGVTPLEGVSVRTLTQIEVQFTEAVAGVDASDLRINDVPAAGLAVLGVGKYRFNFPQPPSGAVTVSWASDHGIHDFASPPNEFDSPGWLYTLNPNLGVPSLRINEILAANVSGLADENGEAQDWIEIWNYGSVPVNLAGYSLSDDVEDPGRWTFPATNLAPGQFLVVFASEKDRKVITSATNRLHTNFKLSPNGEYLGLFNAESPRIPITEFAPEFPEQRNNHSYGYNSSGLLRYFATPTPGGPNGASDITGILSAPHFNVARGYFDAPFTLILSTPERGVTVRYTTDGSEPALGSSNAITYFAPLTISNTTVLRAASFKPNVLPSRSVTHTYLFIDQVVNQPTNPPGFPSNWGPNGSFPGGLVPADYEMDKDPLRVDPNNTASAIDPVKLQRLKDGLRELPVVSITMKLDDIFGTQGLYQRSAVETGTPNSKPQNKKPCSIEMFLPDGTTAFATTCGIDLHGNASRNPQKNPKHGFKLNFRGDFGPSTLQYPVFEDSPVEEYDDLLLRPDFNSSWRHWSDTTTQGLGALQRTRATRTRDAWMKDSFRAMGGLGTHNRFCHVYLNGLYWGTFELAEEPTKIFAKNALGGGEDDFDIYDQGSLKSGTTTAYNAMVALPTATTLAQYDQYKQYLNLVEFIDYMLLHFVMGHQDWSTSVTKNWYAIRKRVAGPEGTFRYLPWDGECILLNEDVNRVTVSTPPSGLHTKLVGNAEYRLAFADRIFRHMLAPGSALAPGTNIARWRKWQAIMDKPIVAESVRWGDYRRDVHRYSEGTYQLYTRENHWLAENTRMMGYFSNRNAIVLGQLRAALLYPAVSAPAFNQQGGPVPHDFSLTMTATNTIYYTLDGSDPRVYGTGAISPNAATYAGAITLTNSMAVKARVRFGTNWSALNEAAFVVDPLASPLRITEIMYNPMGGDAYEYVELRNVSSASVNAGGFSVDGIGYVFPLNTILQPGQVIVLGSDASPGNWSGRYPNATAFGRFGGGLSNGGEKLAIKNVAGQVLWSVDYDDENGWPVAADGGGYSLEILDVFGDPDDPANWRASAAPHGTPGTISPPSGLGAVVLNEVMADNISAVANGGTFPDWVELRNTGGTAVNLAGWSLTDDSNPRKYVFPANTSLAAGAYLTVWCDTNTAAPGLHTLFALGRNGESLFLYDANTNRVDAVGFGVQLANYTIGRLGGGWQLTEPTPGTDNVAVGLAAATNVVINEWLANALPGGDDWVELHNRSAAAPVSLQGLYLGTGDTTYQLTALSFIAPGGHVQLLADENPGGNHLDFRLPAEGGVIVLYDGLGRELDRVSYGAQAQGVTQGRLPDGAPAVLSFPASPSPAASNYLLSYAGPMLNEVLAINRAAVTNAAGRTADFVELRNTNAGAFDLSGMRLSNNPDDPAQWLFPTGTAVPGNGFLVVWFDNEQPASLVAGQLLNTGHSLDGESGEVWLFNSGGQPVDSVVFGFQIADLPLGRASAGGPWALLGSATPGAPNSSPAALGSAMPLRINEWLANSPDADDWFELHNAGPQPVDLSGLFAGDSPAATALTAYAFPALSFIGAKGFVRCRADGHPSNGRNHVNFSLDEAGEALRLYSATLGVIDTVYFGSQSPGVSQGRLPDGGASVVSFPHSATPSESNYLPLPNAVVNEVLTHTGAPLEDAIEIHNPTGAALNIGGWYLSDSQTNFQKFRIPDNTMLPAYGFKVLYENQVNGGAGSLVPFALDATRGDEAWLSAADGAGNLTGQRSGAKFGAASAGASFGRYETSVGVDFPAMFQRTFGVDNPATLAEFRSGGGLSNALPQVGPVVINEIMYQPPGLAGTNDNSADEFIELYNLTASTVPLHDPAAPSNTWHLRGEVDFNFPPSVSLAGHSFLLVVSFNPTTSPADAAAFRSKYGLPASVALYGPYSGKLNNGGGAVELLKPDTAQGFVPYVLVEQVQYDDAFPWPPEATGSGSSLQRRQAGRYGNEPVNWKAEGPTAGRPNAAASTYVDADLDGVSDAWEGPHGLSSSNAADASMDPDGDGRSSFEEFLDGTDPQLAASRLLGPVITSQPQSAAGLPGLGVVFSVTATGTGPLKFQWRRNGLAIPGATSQDLLLPEVQPGDGANFSVVVMNAAGFAVSQEATLVINIPPAIVAQPQSVTVSNGLNATFSVGATGTGLLRYQWRFDGQNLLDKTNSTLALTGVTLRDMGAYTVVVTDDIASVQSAPANLVVLLEQNWLVHPTSQTVPAGSTVTLSCVATGTPPIYFRWRVNNATRSNLVSLDGTSALVLTNVRATVVVNVVITNRVNLVGKISNNATVTVVNPPPITLSSPELLAGGVFRMKLSGETNRSYAIEISSNLTHWSTLSTVQYTNGLMPFSDPSAAAGVTNRFYRARKAE